MFQYVIRRLLLMIPTFFGTTLLVFYILQSVPDGPFEQAVQQIKMQQMQSGEGGASTGGDEKNSMEISEEVLKKMKREFDLDKPIWKRYLIWLGVVAKDIEYEDGKEIDLPFRYSIEKVASGEYADIYLQKWIWIKQENGNLKVYESLKGTDFKTAGYSILPEALKKLDGLEVGYPFKHTIDKLAEGEYGAISLQKWLLVNEEEDGNLKIYESPEGTDSFLEGYTILPDFWDLEDEQWTESNWEVVTTYEDSYGELMADIKSPINNLKWIESDWEIITKNKDGTVDIALKDRQGIFTGYLGHSEKYNESVGQLIWDRLHISAFFGITSFILVYLVCIPLGIIKALWHGSKFDLLSSLTVFIGYSIPSYALAFILLWIFSTTNVFDAPILPSRGWTPDDWENLTVWGKIIGQIKHAILPIIAYMVGSFATLTILMKNSLMENLSQDYVRTAFAKGLTEKRVVFFHAVRNSLIPLATGIGSQIGLFLAGSYLIEKIFGIDGIGLLTFQAIGTRDYGIIMGFLVIGVLIRLFGNLISDLCYALIDPRIRFK